VVGRRLGGGHRVGDDVAVASRTDDAVGHRRHRERGGQLGDELDGPAVDRGKADRVVPETGPPIEVGAPRGGVDHHAEAKAFGQVEVGGVVAGQGGPARLGVEQGERGEVREVDPVPEDEGGLQAAVREVHPLGCQLGKGGRCAHVRFLSVGTHRCVRGKA
jgi:hypothetical protein